MAHLVEENLEVVATESLHHVLLANPLAPIATGTATHAVGEPEAVVIVALRASRALAVVAILVEEPAARRSALRDTLSVGVGIYINTVSRALEEGSILDGPTDDLDVDLGEGEGVEAVKVREPLLVLLAQRCSDLAALGFGDRRAGLPANAVVDFTNE